MPFRTRRLFTRGTPRGCLATSAQWQPLLVGEFIAHYSKLCAGPNGVVSKFPGGHTHSTTTPDLQYQSYTSRTPLARADRPRVRRERDPSPAGMSGYHRRASMVQGAFRTRNAAQIRMAESFYNGAHTAGNSEKFQSPSPVRPTAPPRTLSAVDRCHRRWRCPVRAAGVASRN